MKNYQRVSQYFKWLCAATMGLTPIIDILFWLQAPKRWGIFAHKTGFSLSMIPDGISVMHTLTATDRLLGFLISLIPVGIILFVSFYLFRLFLNYQKNIIFSLDNVTLIKKVGITALIGQVLMLFHEALMSLAITIGNPHGHRFIMLTFTGTNFGIILAAVLAILISWIMGEGLKLKQETELTI